MSACSCGYINHHYGTSGHVPPRSQGDCERLEAFMCTVRTIGIFSALSEMNNDAPLERVGALQSTPRPPGSPQASPGLPGPPQASPGLPGLPGPSQAFRAPGPRKHPVSNRILTSVQKFLVSICLCTSMRCLSQAGPSRILARQDLRLGVPQLVCEGMCM